MTNAVTDPPALSLIDLDSTFLPVGSMRQIARVTQLKGSSIECEIELGRDHWVWEQHFPGDPIFPGTLMIEGAGQLIALWAWSQGVRGRPRLVRTGAQFHQPVSRWTPRLTLKGEVRRKRHLYFGEVTVWSERVPVARVDGVLVVLPHTEPGSYV